MVEDGVEETFVVVFVGYAVVATRVVVSNVLM